MDDCLALERLLRTRLRDRVPGLRDVLGAADLGGIQERAQIVPAAHVLLAGITPTEERDDGRVQRIEQLWYVAIAVRNARDTQGGAGARAEAGPLLAQALRALCGWRPSPAYTPLRLRRPPPTFFSRGFGYYPLAFASQTIVRGDHP